MGRSGIGCRGDGTSHIAVLRVKATGTCRVPQMTRSSSEQLRVVVLMMAVAGPTSDMDGRTCRSGLGTRRSRNDSGTGCMGNKRASDVPSRMACAFLFVP